MATIRTSIMVNDMMSQQFRAMNMAMSSVISSFQALDAASSTPIDLAGLQAAQRELQEVEARLDALQQEINQSEQAQNNLNDEFRTSGVLAGRLLGTIGAIAGTYLSLQGLSEAIRISDEMTDTTARVTLLVDDMPLIPEQSVDVNLKATGMSEIEQAQQLIFEAAQRSYSSFKDTADMVTRIGTNARDAFGNISEVVAFTELVQKQFGIAGANAVEASNATIQLSQALASGVLRGDELNSIFEQAPNLIISIADYLGVPLGKIREMASEGEITADIVKQAMFAAADDINDKFNSMPTTWSQIFTSMKNEALWAFGDVLSYINKIANSDNMKGFLQSAKNQLYALSEYAMQSLQLLTSVGSFVYENWALISPAVSTAVAAVLIYVGALGILKVAQMLSAFWTGLQILALGLHTATSWANVQATLAMTGAAWGLNAALAANPIFWVVMGVMLLIGVFYLAIAAVNHFAGTSISATGIIAGTFYALGTFIYNIIAWMWNIFASIVEFWANVWINPTYSIKRLFANLANNAIDMGLSMIGSFDSAATNLANMFISGANTAITAINWIVDALNEIPGIDIGKMSKLSATTSVTADYSGLKNKINDWVGEAPANYWEAPKMDFGSVPDNFKVGYDWGAGLVDKGKGALDTTSLTSSFDDLANLAGLNLDELAAGAGELGDKLDKGNGAGSDTAKNTKKLADSVDMLDDDLKYLRELAEREAINRYTTAEIKVDMKNENHINSEMDIDGVINLFGEKIEEAAEVIAEGGDMDV